MFKKYPLIKQKEIKECGAASVLMIVMYYGGYVGMDKLGSMLKINRNGTTAFHIVSVLNELGFESKGVRLKNISDVEVPFIAHVIIKNTYKHFIVVYEIKEKYILIADPAKGLKKISHKEFYKIWTGIVITMHPVTNIVKEKRIKKSYIIKIMVSQKIIVIKLLILSFIITILSIISSFFFQSLIEKNNIYFILILIIILNCTLTYIRNRLLIYFTNNVDKYLSEKTFKHIIDLPYFYYHNHTTGEVISRFNDLNILKDLIGKILLTVFIDFPLTLFSGILLFYLNKKLFIVLLVSLFMHLLVLIINHQKNTINIDKVQRKRAVVNSFMTECISGYETVKGINIENTIDKKFKLKYSEYLNSNLTLNKSLNNQSFLNNIISLSAEIIIMIYGMYLVQKGIFEIGFLITYITLSRIFLGPVKEIFSLDSDFKEILNSLRRVVELFENEKQKEKYIGDIYLQNVFVSFDGIRDALQNINLNIEKSNKVLISGVSGSGKSTLLKTIRGYFEYRGTIKIGNKILNYPSNIIYISTKDMLFTDTIKNNLNIKGNNSKLIDICLAKEIIDSYDLKENTLLEENGFNLSQGQKQRIVLARSLYDFDTLLIDEGLNSLNSNLERIILKKLFKHFKIKTIIVVSHRLDNLDLFDQYIKMEKGKIIINEKRC